MRPAKRQKVKDEETDRSTISPVKSVKGKGTPLRTPSVLSFFAPVSQDEQRSRRKSSSISPSKPGVASSIAQSQEEKEMEWAVKQSLMAAQPKAQEGKGLFLGSDEEEACDEDRTPSQPASDNEEAPQRSQPVLTSYSTPSPSPASVVIVSPPARKVIKDDSGYGGSDEAGPSATKLSSSRIPCPCCSKLFYVADVQRHANQCLDSTNTTIVIDDDDSDQDSVSARGESAAWPSPLPASRSIRPSKSPNLKQSRPLSELAIPATSSHDSQPSPMPDNAPAPTKTVNGKPNAFSVMMSSHIHQREWAMADKVEAANGKGRGKASGKGAKGKTTAREEQRQAPFYKVLEGMPISVDAFRFGNIEGCVGYFLSHFHSDHYGGLSANWRHGPVYGSTTTLNLCRTKLGVPKEHLCPLAMETPTEIPNSGGVKVTLIEANHCPGSTIFLFEGPQTAHILPTSIRSAHIGTKRIFRYLHCGDFRASPLHANHPLIKNKHLHIIYLDTTYLNPRYNFPPQEQVVDACAELVAHARPIEEDPGTVHRADPDPPECEDWRPRSMRPGIKWESGDVKDEEDDKDDIISEEELEDEDLVSERPDFVDLADDFDPFDDQVEKAVLKAESQLDEQGVSESVKVIKERIKEEEDGEESAGEKGWTSKHCSQDDQGAVKKEEGDQITSNTATATREANTSETKIDADTESKPQRTVDDLMQRNPATLRGRRKTGRLLVVVGTYTIGKEKVVKAAAKALDTKVFCLDARKYSTYAELDEEREDYYDGTVYGRKEGEEGLHALLTRDAGAGVHVTNLQAVTGDYVRDMLRRLQRAGFPFTHAVGLRPTGWSYRPPQGADNNMPDIKRLIANQQSRTFHWTDLSPTRDSNADVTVYGVPYSEHSSFFELTAFALSVSYGRLIATVNVHSATSRNKMSAWFERWKREKERRAKQDGRPVGSVQVVRSRDERYW